MILGKKIIGSVASKTAKQTAQQASPEIVALQKTVKTMLTQNLDDAQRDISQIVASQKVATEGMEQLAKNIKSMIK